MTIGCTATNVPANLGNYWTGTPTGGLPFRCQMAGDLWLPEGTTPASAGSTADPRLWYPFARSSFVLPGPSSLGIGNTPPTLTYGPGFVNWDLSLFKEFRLGSESRVLQLRIETFNTFNHFNPANPNTGLIYNFTTGAQTNANFGGSPPLRTTRDVVLCRYAFAFEALSLPTPPRPSSPPAPAGIRPLNYPRPLESER
jgi:hypothetical protein